jgi:hypothetical protein
MIGITLFVDLYNNCWLLLWLVVVLVLVLLLWLVLVLLLVVVLVLVHLNLIPDLTYVISFLFFLLL